MDRRIGLDVYAAGNVRLDRRLPADIARSIVGQAINQGVEPNVFTPEPGG